MTQPWLDARLRSAYRGGVKWASGTHRPWAAAAAAIGFTTLGIYLAAISAEGWEENDTGPIVVVSLAIAAGAGMATAAASGGSGAAARWLLRGAAVVLGVLGLMAIFSIGILLLAGFASAVVALGKVPPEHST